MRIMISQLRKKGFSRGYINLHHLSEKISDCISDPGIEFIYEKRLSGSAILRELYDIGEDLVLVVNGDIFLELPTTELLTKMSESDADGILLVKSNSGGYSTIQCKGDRFTGLSGGINVDRFMYTGVALFKRKILKDFNEISFFDSLRRIEADIRIVEYKKIWLDIGTPELYYFSDLKFRKYSGSKNLNSISECVKIEEGSAIENSILWKGSEIGRDVRLKRCIVTGNLTVKEGSYRDKIITGDGVFDLKSL